MFTLQLTPYIVRPDRKPGQPKATGNNQTAPSYGCLELKEESLKATMMVSSKRPFPTLGMVANNAFFEAPS